jgi:hypothetical protein
MHEVWKPRLNIAQNRVDMRAMPKPSLQSAHVGEVTNRILKYKEEQAWAFARMDHLYMNYLLRSLYECDWPWPAVGGEIRAENWAKLLPQGMNARLVESYLHLLANFGLLRGGGGVYELIKPLPSLAEVEKDITRTFTELTTKAEPDDIGLLFAQHFGSHLTQVLLGKISALAVMFPEDENAVGAIRFYSECPWYLANR